MLCMYDNYRKNTNSICWTLFEREGTSKIEVSVKKNASLKDDKNFLQKIEKVEESIEALEQAGVDSIVVDSPTGHRFYTLVGSDEPAGILIDTVNEAAACLSTDGTILYSNARFAEILKTSSQSILGKKFTQYFTEPHRASIVKMLQNNSKGNLDVQLLTSDGSLISVYLHFSRIVINHVERINVLIMDMSEKERSLRHLTELNNRLEESIRSRDSFLAAMSHNLRTPLNSIVGFTDILLSKMPGSLNDEQEKQLQIIARCSKQLMILIRQLLDVGLIQHDKLEPAIAAFDINSIISHVLQEVKPLADQKNLELSFTYPKEQMMIKTDKKLFRQVIVNLLDNAIKYTQKGFVHVSESLFPPDQPRFLNIQVIDTGIGIKEEDLNEIFKLYSSPSKKEDPYGEHTGLGLVLCCKYCEVLGMKLTCESTYGQGTCFTIQIPLGVTL